MCTNADMLNGALLERRLGDSTVRLGRAVPFFSGPCECTCIATSIGFAVVGWVILTMPRSACRRPLVARGRTRVGPLPLRAPGQPRRLPRPAHALPHGPLHGVGDRCLLHLVHYTCARLAGACFLVAWTLKYVMPDKIHVSSWAHTGGHLATLAL